MKSTLLLSSSLLVLAACQSSAPQENELGKLMHERDSLYTVRAELDKRLTELDQTIATMDTTKHYTQVSTLPVSPDRFSHYFDVVGKVEADQSINLLPETSGTITSVLVKEGDRVSAGQLLAQLDGKILERSLDEVQTQLTLANTLYEKQQRLWDQKIGSEVQYLQAKNNKESLETRAATLRAQLANTQIRAPFSGTVDRIFLKEGEMAAPQTPVMRLVDLSKVFLRADVSESYLTRVSKGSEVLLTFPSIGHEEQARVTQVSQYIQPDNRTFSVRVDLKNADGVLKPNLMANMSILDYRKDSTLAVPSRLVQQSPSGENYVYLLDTEEGGLGRVKKQFIKAGVSYNGLTEVLEGLTPGDRVIDKGARAVKDGQRVEVSKN